MVHHTASGVARTDLPRPSGSLALAPAAHVLLRVAVGLLFMEHGLQKLFGAFGGVGPGGTVKLVSQFGLAGVLEFGGGLLLVIGFLVRPVALLVTIEMLWAFFQVHFPRGGWPIENGGELALLYASVFAFLAATGAGAYSVDAILHPNRVPRDSAPPPI